MSIGLGLFVLLLVFGFGLGVPYTYWLHVSQIQAFEAEEGVVLFVEVERDMRYPGYLHEAPIRKTMGLYRIHIAGDGQVRQTRLHVDSDITFNTNIAPIIKLADHFYLVQGRSMGRPSCQLHRVLDDRILSLDFVDSDQILETIGLTCDRPHGFFNFSDMNAISARTGWSRINDVSHLFFSFSDREKLDITPKHHELNFQIVKAGSFESIVVESPPGPNHWSKPLLTVNTTRWRSYSSPFAWPRR